MAYKNFIFRVDDRLIHGQVNVGWISPLNLKKVYVVDDKVFSDSFLIQLWQLSLPPEVELFVLSENDFKSQYKQLDFNNTLLLVNSIQKAYNLFLLSSFNGELNLGGLHYEENKIEFLSGIFLSYEDINYLKKCLSMDIKIYIQLVFSSNRIFIDEHLIEKWMEVWQKKHN